MACRAFIQGLRVWLVHSFVDYSLFTQRKGDIFLTLSVYVDDIVLASNDSKASKTFKAYVNGCFNIKDLGPLKYFPNIEVAREPQEYFPSKEICLRDN